MPKQPWIILLVLPLSASKIGQIGGNNEQQYSVVPIPLGWVRTGLVFGFTGKVGHAWVGALLVHWCSDVGCMCHFSLVGELRTFALL